MCLAAGQKNGARNSAGGRVAPCLPECRRRPPESYRVPCWPSVVGSVSSANAHRTLASLQALCRLLAAELEPRRRRAGLPGEQRRGHVAARPHGFAAATGHPSWAFAHCHHRPVFTLKVMPRSRLLRNKREAPRPETASLTLSVSRKTLVCVVGGASGSRRGGMQ